MSIDTQVESIKAGPDDPLYRATVDKRFNKRFRANPDYVRLVGSTDQVVSAVEDAVSEGGRLVVTSGGHAADGGRSSPTWTTGTSSDAKVHEGRSAHDDCMLCVIDGRLFYVR